MSKCGYCGQCETCLNLGCVTALPEPRSGRLLDILVRELIELAQEQLNRNNFDGAKANIDEAAALKGFSERMM